MIEYFFPVDVKSTTCTKKDAKTYVLVVFLFLIYPLASVPAVFCEIFRQKRYAYTLLALFMGLCAILFPPFADLYRHQMYYQQYVIADEGIKIVTSNGYDFLLYTLSNAFACMSINFEWVRFFFAFASYQIVFCLFSGMIENNPTLSTNRKYAFCLFLCLYLLVPFIWIVNGLRFTLSSIIVLLAFYRLYILKAKYDWIVCCFIAIITHFGVIPMILVLIINLLFKNKSFSPRKIFVVSLFAYLFSNYALLDLIMGFALDENAQRVATVYVKNSSGFSENRSLFGLIASLLERAALYPLIIFIFYNRSFHNGAYNFLLSLIVLISLSFPFMVLYERVTLFAIPVFLVYFIWNFSIKSSVLKYLQCLLLCAIISNLATLYGYREPFMNGRFYKLLYSPATFIMQNTYEDSWIRYHLDTEGEFKNVIN